MYSHLSNQPSVLFLITVSFLNNRILRLKQSLPRCFHDDGGQEISTKQFFHQEMIPLTLLIITILKSMNQSRLLLLSEPLRQCSGYSVSPQRVITAIVSLIGMHYILYGDAVVNFCSRYIPILTFYFLLIQSTLTGRHAPSILSLVVSSPKKDIEEQIQQRMWYGIDDIEI